MVQAAVTQYGGHTRHVKTLQKHAMLPKSEKTMETESELKRVG